MNGPIFLGGVAGSGKTLLRLVLSSHPHLAISRRTYMWTRFYNRYGDLQRPANLERCLNAMLARKAVRALRPDPERIRREFWQGEPTYARLFALFHQHFAEQLGRPRWGDQLGYVEHYADPIFTAYPDAKMIHMIRDPREWHEASQERRRRRMGAAGAAAARWLRSATAARRNQNRYPAQYKMVRYEALLARPEETIRDICAFLGEDFIPGMLTMEGALRFSDARDSEPPYKAPDETSGVPGLRPIESAPREALDASKSRREIAFIQACARPHLIAFGYDLKPTRFSFLERLLFYAVDWPVNSAGMIAWRFLLARQLV